MANHTMDGGKPKKPGKLPIIIIAAVLVAAGFILAPRLMDIIQNNQAAGVDEDEADEVVYVDLGNYSTSIPPAAAEAETPRVSMTGVSMVTATSYLEETQYGFVHGPSNVVDGNLSSAWVEDAAGQGVGEAVTIHLDGIYAQSGFTIHAGYQKSAGTYANNSRPASLRVTFSDGESMESTARRK